MNDILNEALDSDFVRPARHYKGQELAPYTEGSRLILNQVRNEDDSGMFFVWSFLYVHIMLKKNKREIISLAWNKDKFRETLFEWVSGFDKEDSILAENIVVEIINEANKAIVETIPSPNQLPDQPGNK